MLSQVKKFGRLLRANMLERKPSGRIRISSSVQRDGLFLTASLIDGRCGTMTTGPEILALSESLLPQS